MEARKKNLNKDYEKEFLEKYYPLNAGRQKGGNWFLGAQKRQIDSRLKCGALLLSCDDHTRSEVNFEIPFSYLRSHIFNRVGPNSKGVYKFHIDRTTYLVTWGPKGNKITIDGARFITGATSRQSLNPQADKQSVKSPRTLPITRKDFVIKLKLLETRISQIEGKMAELSTTLNSLIEKAEVRKLY